MSEEMQEQVDGMEGGMEEGSDGLSPDLVAATQRRPLNRNAIILFVVVVAGVGGMWLMHRRSGPDTASAASAAQAVAAKQTITQFLDSGGQNIKAMEAMLRNTEKIVQQFLKYPSMNQVPLTDLKTNPFRMSGAAEDGDPNADKFHKQAERLAMLKAVQGLALQSIMHSERARACMINNMLYQEGQQVEGFTIEKITPASVVVRNSAYRFELRMAK